MRVRSQPIIRRLFARPLVRARPVPLRPLLGLSRLDAMPRGAVPTPLAELPAPPLLPCPAWFKLAPVHVELPTLEVARHEMGHGRPFPPAIAAQFYKILGETLTPEGFEKLYAPLLPNCVWVVSNPQLDSGNASSSNSAEMEGAKGANFIISAVDRRGRIVFESGVAMCRHADSALEVNLFGADVTPEYRGQGITARAELLNERLLQALSTHPNTRFSLTAGSAEDGNTGSSQRGTGTLVHAARGYLFTDSVEMPSYFTDSPQDFVDAGSQASRMATQFASWIEQEPSLTYIGMPATASLRQELATKAARCQQPWEFMRLAKSGCSATAWGLDGRLAPSDVGVAFLVSPKAGTWRGVRFVNALGTPCEPQLAQVRASSQAVFGVQIAHELEAAAGRTGQMTARLWAQVHSAQPQVRAAAYLELGLHGDVSVTPFLREQLYGSYNCFKAARETDPQVLTALHEALFLLSGSGVRPGLQAAAQRLDITQEARDRMGWRLAALDESGR